MKRRIPENAFQVYEAMGSERSYEQLAARFGVTKRAIAKAAARERWQERLEAIQRQAHESFDQRLLDLRKQAFERHLKVMRYIQTKAIETLQALPLASAMDAVRAYCLAVDKERLLLGDPTERTAVSIEEVTRRELASLLLRAGESESPIETLEDSGGKWAASKPAASDQARSKSKVQEEREELDS